MHGLKFVSICAGLLVWMVAGDAAFARGFGGAVGGAGGFRGAGLSPGGYMGGASPSGRGGLAPGGYMGGAQPSGGWGAGGHLGGAPGGYGGRLTPGGYMGGAQPAGTWGPGGYLGHGPSGPAAGMDRGLAPGGYMGGAQPRGGLGSTYRGGVPVGTGRLPGELGHARAAIGPVTWRAGATDLARQGNLVRSSLVGHRYFDTGWYGRHPNAWRAAAWTTGMWVGASWAALGGYFGGDWLTTPYDYDYGTTVVFEDGNVYSNGQQVATESTYAQQAATIAAAGNAAVPAGNQPWQSLGVFALAQQGQDRSNDIFQLAVNAQGSVRGNYFNALTNQTESVVGSVDQKSQRVAWNVGGQQYPVYEAGLYNLTKDQTPILVHFSEKETQQWILYRLKDDGSNGSAKSTSSATGG